MKGKIRLGRVLFGKSMLGKCRPTIGLFPTNHVVTDENNWVMLLGKLELGHFYQQLGYFLPTM